MGWWLASGRTVQDESVISRFDARFWTVNFPRPMMAAVTSGAADALCVDCVFYRADDLAGLIWEAEDRARSSAAGLRHRAGFPRVPVAVPLAVGGDHAARCGQRTRADDQRA